jgi:uncharacterized hydrophobic protein (TIGR00271 family)
VLQLRVYGTAEAMAIVADRLDVLSGARHVSLTEGIRDSFALVTADVRAESADHALTAVERLGVPSADVTLVRLDTIGPLSEASGSIVVIWADVLSRARTAAKAPALFLILMAVAGVIAAFGVIDESSVLIVGAMAISPDLLPITAACTGLVLRRRRLVQHGLWTLVLGLGVTCAFAAAVTGFLRLFDLLPSGFALQEIPADQTHVNAATILVALAAGVAGMLAVETRARSAVGVAISVTTIPAAAFFGVAVGIGEFGKSWSALGVLATNVAMMLVGGSLALAVQRTTASKSPTRPAKNAEM